VSRPLRDAPKIDGAGHGNGFELKRVFRADFESVLRRVLRHDDRGEDERDVFAGFFRQVARAARQGPEIRFSGALHRALEPAQAAVVRGEHEVPVAIEHVVQELQVLCRGDRRFFRVGPLVDVPVGFEALLGRGRAHELPRAFRARARERVRLEAALDHRDVGEVERQPGFLEDPLDHRQVLRSAGQAFLDVVAQAALKELDVREHAVVLRNRYVVLGRGEVVLDRLLGCRVGGRLGERGDLEELVDRRRLGLLFGEPVALREGGHFVRVDAIDQPIEVFAQARLGPGPVRRFEQDVHRAIEFGPRAFEMADLELALPSQEMLLGGLDQFRNGIDRG
jgi:hypothetical protein